MRVMLILNCERARNVGVIVRLHKELKLKVQRMLRTNRNREAFDLMARKAMVESCVPAGSPVATQPDLTLVEQSDGGVVVQLSLS